MFWLITNANGQPRELVPDREAFETFCLYRMAGENVDMHRFCVPTERGLGLAHDTGDNVSK